MKYLAFLLFSCLLPSFDDKPMNKADVLVPKSKQVSSIDINYPDIIIIKARITYWTHDEPGYKWGKKVASNPNKVAIEGITVAVDPKKIKYNSIVFIPILEDVVGDGVFIAEDTGSAVKSLAAIPKEKRKEVNHVIDVYVDSTKKMNELSKKMPEYTTIYVLKQ